MNSQLTFSLGMSAMVFGLMNISAQKKDNNHPNVVFILCDDLNDAVEGFGGHPQTKTPNLNRLRQMGVSFTNNHSNCPLSGPSRASLLTGIYPHHSGVFGFDQQKSQWINYPLLKNVTTIFEHFRNNGYEVYGTGKLFHNNHGLDKVFPDNSYLGFHLDYGPFPWDGKGIGKGSDLAKVTPLCRLPFGATHMSGFGALDETLLDTAYYKGWRYSSGKVFQYVNENNRSPMPDEISTQFAVDIINKKHDKPFFITVGLVRPHDPWYAPRKNFDRFPLNEIELPKSYLKDDRNDCAPILNKPIYEEDTFMFSRFSRLQESYGPEEGYKRFIQAFLACVSFMDDQVGGILDALEKNKLIDNTIIVFTSDNGFHIGEKDWIFKRTIWEKGTKVPLIIHAPGIAKKHGVCEFPVSLIHLYPTLNDLCNIPGQPNEPASKLKLDGVSLRPFLDNPATTRWDGPQFALSCIFGQTDLKQCEPGDIAKQHFTVRSDRYRYILCSNGEEELYDHKKDPYEWKNLATDKKYATIKSELKKQMKELLKRADY